MSERTALVAIGVVSLAVVSVVAWLVAVPAPRVTQQTAGVALLPTVNAVLNGTSAALLVLGYAFIRRRRVALHRAAMLGACGVSTLFLVSYVTYHVQAGSVRFAGQGPVRAIYFFLLVTHIVLAAAIVPLALVTLLRAWRGDFARHRAIARVTLPTWLYVSITGVLVYWMLYHAFAAGP